MRPEGTRADRYPPRPPQVMPYLVCPSCHLTVYSAAKVSTVDECPRCGTILGRTGSIFGAPLPSRPPSGADLAGKGSRSAPPVRRRARRRTG